VYILIKTIWNTFSFLNLKSELKFYMLNQIRKIMNDKITSWLVFKFRPDKGDAFIK